MKISPEVKAHALDVRTILFVPALSPAFIEKAHLRGADAIIIDLEDSIPPDLKSQGREAVARAITQVALHLPVYVRVNNSLALLDADLVASVTLEVVGIVLPKAETAGQVREVAARIAQLSGKIGRDHAPLLVLLVETPLGVHLVAELATAHESVVALIFGSEDYSALLGVRPSPEAMTVPAQMISMAARARGLAAWGVAGTIVEIADGELLKRVAADSRQLGFTGTIAVNPKQIAIFNDAFGVSAQELEWARDTLEIFNASVKEGRAAVAHKGKMIDTPVAVRAEMLVARAQRAAQATTSKEAPNV
jgi:citrate lyase subunit beta/citryl-CoA lyase